MSLAALTERGGWPSDFARAAAVWHRTMSVGGFDTSKHVWGWEVWASFILLTKRYAWMPKRMGALEHRINEAKFRGLTAEQFDRELQSEVQAREMVWKRRDDDYQNHRRAAAKENRGRRAVAETEAEI